MKYFLLALAMIALGYTGQAQGKPKTTTTPTMPELPKLISTMQLPYKVVDDSTVVIPYGGEYVKDFNVVIQQASDLYIVYSNLSEAIPGKLDETKHKYLLQRNADFDMVKIGLSESGYYLRVDVFRKGMTSPTLKRIITQVANVTNIIGGDLK